MLKRIKQMHLRLYAPADKGACLALLDGNMPVFFAPHERDEFDTFLNDPGDRYWVVEDDAGVIVGCSGYWVVPDTPVATITWTMVARSWHRRGVGRRLLLTCLDHLCRVPAVQAVRLETSQHVTGFYEQVGDFYVQGIIENGYAPGLHKIEMRTVLSSERCAAIARQLATLNEARP